MLESFQVVVLSQADPSHWAQFGLAGCVICALFGTLNFFITQHRSERETLLGIHKDERKEWRHEASEREAGLRQALTQLEDAIRDTRRG